MHQWISSHHLHDSSYPHSFLSALPFPHIILPHFLTQHMFTKLSKALKKESFTFYNSDLYQFRQTQSLYTSQNTFIKSFCSFWTSPELLQLIMQITGKKINPSPDISGFLYTHTDYLLPHDDHVTEEDSTRKIAYIYYLSNFTASDGGQLDFFDSTTQTVARSYLPTENSLLLFDVSKSSFHQMREILTPKKRFTITGWFHGH